MIRIWNIRYEAGQGDDLHSKFSLLSSFLKTLFAVSLKTGWILMTSRLEIFYCDSKRKISYLFLPSHHFAFMEPWRGLWTSIYKPLLEGASACSFGWVFVAYFGVSGGISGKQNYLDMEDVFVEALGQMVWKVPAPPF